MNIKEATIKAARGIWNSVPTLAGVILLVGLVNSLIPKSFYKVLFSQNAILDSFVGTMLGSIFAGNPVTSYVIGGELLAQGITLMAVTAFLVAWVTVGVVQLPAEIMLLGKKFAIVRNITSFVFAIAVAIVTVFIVGVI